MKLLKATLCGFLLSLTACPGVGQLLRMYGFTEVRPPSLFFEPGSMVWVKTNRPFTAGVICTQRTSLGPTFVPLVSPTADASLTKASNTSFELDAQYMDIVHGDIAFSAVSGITAQMQNPVIYAVNDVDVLDNVQQRDPACTQAISGRRQAGYKVTMISSALMADVVYTVSFKSDAKIDVSAKLAMLQNLALTLKLERATVKDDTISAKGLFWGITDDTYLASLGEPQGVPAGSGARLIPAHEIPALGDTADAP